MSSLLIPKEFIRKPRSFDEIASWKAVEFRQFVLYTGLLVLKESTSDVFFNHFLLLSCAYRIMSCPLLFQSKNASAHIMLNTFVQKFGNIFGLTSLTYNVHNLLHLSQTVEEYGNLSYINAYPFENCMKDIKKADILVEIFLIIVVYLVVIALAKY
ncbi:hypothetical protein CVS40_12020 [Lucilia cuprina]|nr:hypothetical protein CVS40_12020 [Lucilia cuprina]